MGRRWTWRARGPWEGRLERVRAPQAVVQAERLARERTHAAGALEALDALAVEATDVVAAAPERERVGRVVGRAGRERTARRGEARVAKRRSLGALHMGKTLRTALGVAKSRNF